MGEPAKNVRFAESLHKEQLKYAPDQISMAPVATPQRELERTQVRAPGVMDEQFPTDSLTSYSEKDKEMVARIEASKASGVPGVTPFGLMLARDEDFKWAQEKQAVAEVANFQKWFAEEFDKMDPAQKQRAKELYPEFYRERKRLLKKQAKNLMRLAKIKLEGIQDFKDLQTSYLAETGRLDVGPLNNILHPESDLPNKGGTQQTFVRGLANPFSVFGKEAYPWNINGRKNQHNAFESRDWAADSTYNGVESSGFPPFKGDSTSRGDVAWFDVLSSGLPQ